MRFVYISVNPVELPALRVGIGSDNLFSKNQGPVPGSSHFNCGDLVVNFSPEYGEIVSIDGYLPYFDELPTQDVKMPTTSVYARLHVGDLTGAPIFRIEELPLCTSLDRKILHAGVGESKEYIKISDHVIFGLNDVNITDIYIYLTE